MWNYKEKTTFGSEIKSMTSDVYKKKIMVMTVDSAYGLNALALDACA